MVNKLKIIEQKNSQTINNERPRDNSAVRRQTRKDDNTTPIEKKLKPTNTKVIENMTEIFQVPTSSKTLPPNPLNITQGNVNV